jgi:hypothetical protein
VLRSCHFGPHFWLRMGHALPIRGLNLAIFASFLTNFWTRGADQVGTKLRCSQHREAGHINLARTMCRWEQKRSLAGIWVGQTGQFLVFAVMPCADARLATET